MGQVSNPIDPGKIDTNIEHTGSKAGFFSRTPIARVAAYIKNFATKSRTHSSRTAESLTDNTGETADSTVENLPVPNIVGGVGTLDVTATRTSLSDFHAATERNQADLAGAINKVRDDQRDTAAALNQLLEDLKNYGLLE